MSKLTKRITEKLTDERGYHTFSIRISKKHYDLLQDLEGTLEKKPAVLARACLESAIEELYESTMWQEEK